MIGVYVRVSTEEQAKHGYSLSDQLKQCREKAATDDLKEYIDDGYSGEFLERPGLEQLRQDVRDGLIERVIIYDPDRWSRNLMNQLVVTDEIEKRAQIEFVNGTYDKTPEGRLFYQMRGAISEFEKAKITQRMSRGRKEKARQGRVLRDFGIYGFSFDNETRQLTIKPEEAEIVRLIFDLFTRPNDTVQGVNGIAKYLTESQVPTKRGGTVWHRQVVRQILLNRTYTGEFFQNKWDTEGMLGNKHKKDEDKIQMKLRPEEEWIKIDCPTIIEIEQFERAQVLLSESRRRFAKSSLNPYLLSGMVRCGECGNTMTGRKSKNWGTHVFEYTDIKNTAGAKNRGCGMRVKCEELDELIWNRILLHLDEEKEGVKEEEGISQKGLEEAELERIEKEIEKLKAARKRLVKLFASEDLDDAGNLEVREQLKELTDKEKMLTDQSEKVRATLNHSRQAAMTRHSIQEAADFYLKDNNGEFSFEEKQGLIRMIVREVRVFKDRTDIYGL